MIQLRRIVAISVFCVLAGALAFGTPAMAQNALSIGTVDVEKAFDGHTKKNTLEQELQNEVAQARQWFALREENMLLSEREFDELWTAKSKANPTDADRKKIDELQETAARRETELRTLQQKQEYTEEETAKLKEYQGYLNRARAQYQERQAAEENTINQRRVDLSRQIMEDVEAAVAEVAKEKGLSLVFNKSAGSAGLIVFSTVDITDEVMQRLNR